MVTQTPGTRDLAINSFSVTLSFPHPVSNTALTPTGTPQQFWIYMKKTPFAKRSFGWLAAPQMKWSSRRKGRQGTPEPARVIPGLRTLAATKESQETFHFHQPLLRVTVQTWPVGTKRGSKSVSNRNRAKNQNNLSTGFGCPASNSHFALMTSLPLPSFQCQMTVGLNTFLPLLHFLSWHH